MPKSSCEALKSTQHAHKKTKPQTAKQTSQISFLHTMSTSKSDQRRSQSSSSRSIPRSSGEGGNFCSRFEISGFMGFRLTVYLDCAASDTLPTGFVHLQGQAACNARNPRFGRQLWIVCCAFGGSLSVLGCRVSQSDAGISIGFQI